MEMKKEVNSKIFLIAIVAILAVVLLINNFNDLTGKAVVNRGSPGLWTYCSYSHGWICGDGEGDCDKDADCKPGLKCVKDVGANYGWGGTIDVCEGVAAEPTKEEPKCTDSDGYLSLQESYYVKGTATGLKKATNRIETFVDTCDPNNAQIGEIYCKEGFIETSFYSCPNLCRNGACNPYNPNAPKCVDSDDGLDYYTKGSINIKGGLIEEDYCDTNYGYEGYIFEYHCPEGFSSGSTHYLCPNGCKDGVCIKGETTVYGGEYEEVALGSSFVKSLSDNNGIFRVDKKAYWNEDLIVQTSLTASEDDYQTDIVLEVGKDVIRYYLNIPSGGIVEKTFDFLGNQITIKNIISNTQMSIQINNQIKTVQDGDSFIGEDWDNPKWVWDLNNLDTNNPIIGIENDFVYNDDSDNPPKVGKCIYLPNNYAKVCLDGTNIKYDADYQTYTIEYESSADLSEAGGKSIEKTIYIHTVSSRGIKLTSGPYIRNEIWLTGDGRVYYREPLDNKIKFLKKITGADNTIGIINDDLKLFVDKIALGLDWKIHIKITPLTGLSEYLDAVFSVKNEEIFALGDTQSMEEAGELTWIITGRDVLNIGTKDEDHRTAYGIIIRDPKSHGASDEVVLDIPPKQVKARVSMSFKGSSTCIEGIYRLSNNNYNVEKCVHDVWQQVNCY